MITTVPRDSRVAERLPHCLVEHVTDLYLLPVGAALITEPLNVNNDDGPVDSQPSIHVLSR